MRKITMKSTKSTSENGGSVGGNSEERDTNFSDVEDNHNEDDIAENDEKNKSFDSKDDGLLTDDEDDKHEDDESGNEDAGKDKKKAKDTKKKSNATANGKASKKKPKKKKGSKDDDADDEKEYEVEKIMNKRKSGSKVFYLIRWKGYTAKDDTWEAENTLNCSELIEEYLENEKKSAALAKKNGPYMPRRKQYRIDYAEDEDDENFGDYMNNVRKRRGGAEGGSSKSKKSRKSDGEPKKKEEEYEVDKILEVKNTKKGREFLVRWKGYPESQATWEPEKNLNCRDLLDKFLEKENTKENRQKNNKVAASKSPQKSKKIAAKSPASRKGGRSKGRQSVKYYDSENSE